MKKLFALLLFASCLFAQQGMVTQIPSAAVTSGGGGSGGDGNSTYNVNCAVQYTTGLSFTVGVCDYYIAGVQYSISALTTVTLDAADGSNPRIDAIIVDNTGTATKVTGTAAASPATPSIDPATQLALTFVYVAAMASTPTGISTVTIYDENTEWTSAVSSGVLAAGSTSNPYHLTKDVEGTAVTLNSYITFTKPAAGTENLQNYNVLNCYVRSKGSWPTGGGGGTARRNLTFSWLSGATQVGYGVLLQSGVFGFDSSLTTVYQLVSIPVSLFGTGSNTVTTLKIAVSGNTGSSTIGFYIDWCQLQTGGGSFTSSGNMNFQRTWNNATSYAINDTVVYNGVGYVALVTNTNVTPSSSTSATWAKLASAPVYKFGAGFTNSGSAIAATTISLPVTAPAGCTIIAWAISEAAAEAGTATVKFLKVAAGTTSPAIGDSINTSGVSLSSGDHVRSTTLTDFTTTTVTQGDVIAVALTAVTGSITGLTANVECQ